MHFRRQRDILLTLQERRSRLTLAGRRHGKDADLTAKAIAAELGGHALHQRVIPKVLRRRVRPAREGDRHHRPQLVLLRPAQQVAARLDQERERSAPPRPSRKTSLREHTDDDIDDVIWNLDATPRKCLEIPHPDRGVRQQPRCRTCRCESRLATGLSPRDRSAGRRGSLRCPLLRASDGPR